MQSQYKIEILKDDNTVEKEYVTPKLYDGSGIYIIDAVTDSVLFIPGVLWFRDKPYLEASDGTGAGLRLSTHWKYHGPAGISRLAGGNPSDFFNGRGTTWVRFIDGKTGKQVAISDKKFRITRTEKGPLVATY